MNDNEHQHHTVISRVVHDLCGPMGTQRDDELKYPPVEYQPRVVSWGFRAAVALRRHAAVRNTVRTVLCNCKNSCPHNTGVPILGGPPPHVHRDLTCVVYQLTRRSLNENGGKQATLADSVGVPHLEV